MKTITLKPSKHNLKWSGTHPTLDVVSWLKAPPFAVNKRGKLTHRVKEVTTHARLKDGDWTESHHSVRYLCGNGCCFEVFSEHETLVSDPPRDRLLCEGCERVAKRKNLPSGDKLAGRHVHRGILVPQQTCCGGGK